MLIYNLYTHMFFADFIIQNSIKYGNFALLRIIHNYANEHCHFGRFYCLYKTNTQTK